MAAARHFLRPRTLVLALVVSGCTTDLSGSGSARACVSIENRTFETPTALECGLGPNGPQTCIWHITFDGNDHFMWQHSSIANETGQVTCSGATITSAQPAYSGTYDATSGNLTWQGQVYHPI